jgi:Zn-dependent protease with chaperone function
MLASRLTPLLLFAAPLLVELGFLFLTDYPALANRWSPWTPIPGWPGPEALLQLIPLALAHTLFLARPGDPFFVSLLSRENVRARIALFAWFVLGLYLVLSGIVGHVPLLRIWVDESTFANLAFSIVMLVGLIFLGPRLLLLVLDTVPLEGFHRHLAEELSTKLGVRPPRLFEWRTGDELANAMVLAMPLAPRPILFTDVFLRQLSMTELRAVLAHELGHVAGGHVSLFASFILGAALLAEGLLGDVLDGSWGVLVGAIFLVGLAGAVGFISRRLELEADLFALETTGEATGLEAALRRAGGHGPRRRGWRHFSTSTRSIFLRAASHDPGVGVRLRQSVRRLRHTSFGLAIAGALAITVDAVGSLPVERFWVDLRLGHFEAASEGLVSLAPEDFVAAGRSEYATPQVRSELEMLVGLAGRLQDEGNTLTTTRLGELAAEQFEQGNTYRVGILRDLAYLIADPNADLLIAALEGDGVARTQLPTWEPVLDWLRRSP